MQENNSMGERSNGVSFLATFAVVLISIIGLIVIDQFLANLDRSENLAEAKRLYGDGLRAAQERHYGEAEKSFRASLADARENRDYQLELARALLKEGKYREAEDQLRDLLRRDANDGAVNLAMARLYAQEGQNVEAASYFHRAIYGQWPAAGDVGASDAWVGASRLQARFELTSLLAKSGDQKALLAELLPLQDEAPKDLATEKRVAQLYIQAGSPGRAVAMYRQMLHASPDAQHDVEVRTGLAEAEFAAGSYRDAEADYQAALRLAETPQARHKLELCRQVLELDPTQRGIGVRERFERSRQLVERALERFQRCPNAAAPTQQGTDLAEQAQAALQGRIATAELDSAMESNIALTERLWRASAQSCAGEARSEDPVTLVLARIAR